MERILISRLYCVSVIESTRTIEKLDFKQLQNESKVTDQPAKEVLNLHSKKVEIGKSTLHLLESLALVNLDGEEALKTLINSVQFAKNIKSIDIKDKTPLYTVLEDQLLHLRSDKVNKENCRENILKNAKLTEEDYFISPPGNISLKQ